jgi:hypothetical protein
MKASVIAASALAALLVVGVAAVALATSGAVSFNHNNGLQGHHGGPATACRGLTPGETLTLTGLTGHYSNATSHSVGGNASGSLSLKVGQVFLRGCTVSITGGSVTLGTGSYSITGGSMVMNHDGRSGTGSGTTSSGAFLITLVGLHGNSTSASAGLAKIDFSTGTSEFLVTLGFSHWHWH